MRGSKMLKKMKRSFIYFMCTVLLVTSISLSAYKPLKVNATGLEIPIAIGGYEAAMLLLDLIAAGLVCCGAYNLYEDDERFSQVVDEYIGSVTDVGRVWGDVGDTTGTFVRDPNTGQWVQNPDTIPWNDKPQVLTPEEQQKYNLPTNYYPTGKDLIADVWKYRNSGGGGGNGGGSGSGGESGSNNTVYEAIVGSAVVASIGSFLGDLFSGEIDTSGSPALDEWLQGNMDSIEYTGYKDTSVFDMKVVLTNSKGERLECISSIVSENGIVRPYGYIDSSGALSVYYLQYTYDSSGILAYNNVYSPTFHGSYFYPNGNVSPWVSSLKGLYVQPYQSYGSILSCNFPVFYNGVGYDLYRSSGDDSGCINKEKPKFAMLDMKGMASNFPTTFAPLTSGKAVTDKALKDFIDGMTDYKNTADPESLTDPDTHTQKAQETIQKAVEDNEVKEETKPYPAPLPDIPNPDKVTIDGSDATRDWRLVFPFCIPFDIIDLIRVFQAEPEAPRFEIPLKVEEYGIDYTFVLDLAPFESLAVIFRLFERIMFILGLAVLTGKVIKW